MFEFNFECLLFRSIFDKTQPDPSPTDNCNSNWWLTVELDPIIALNHHPQTRNSQNPLIHYVGGWNMVCEFNLNQLEDICSKTLSEWGEA